MLKLFLKKLKSIIKYIVLINKVIDKTSYLIINKTHFLEY